MKRYLPFAVGMILALVVACADSEATPESRSDTGDGSSDFALSSAGTEGTLPGVIVSGSGEVKAEPDRVRVRLTVGSGEDYMGWEGPILEEEFFDSGGPTLEIVNEDELDPVIEALKGEGVSEEDVSVSTFAQPVYDPYSGSAAQITFLWPRPAELETILETAQDAIRRDTDYGLQGLEVAFTLSECEPLEEEAEEAALEDARRKAERLASMADLSLGGITAISEAPGLLGLYAGPTGCDALEDFPSLDYYYYPAADPGSPSEVTVSVTLQVTFALR